MGLDISTQYTKEQNKKCGRNGYCMAHREKCTVISPRDYGMFIQEKRKKGGKVGYESRAVGPTLRRMSVD